VRPVGLNFLRFPKVALRLALRTEKLQINADGKVQSLDGKGDAHRKVIVERIEFDQPVQLSNSDVEQIIKTANEHEWDADSSAWIDELTEVGLRSAWQDQGYFKIALTAHAQSIGGDTDYERFLVAVHVENEGPQFYLGDLHLRVARRFPRPNSDTSFHCAKENCLA